MAGVFFFDLHPEYDQFGEIDRVRLRRLAAVRGPFRSAGRRNAPAVILAAMLAGLAIRLGTADYPLWRDELSSLVFASQPLSRLWSAWMLRETNPPLFYSMLHLWVAAGARSVVAIRVLPIAGGVAAIGLVAALATRLASAWAGPAAGLIAAVSAQQVWFSQEVRGYIFEVDGLLVSMLGLVAWIEGGRRARAGLAAYALGAAFGFYCHVTLAIWPLAAGLALPALRWRWLAAERLAAFALANAALGALCAWWLWIASHQLASDNIDHIRPMPLTAHLALVWHNTILIFDAPPNTRLLRYALTLAIAAGAYLLARRSGPGRVLILAWLLAVLLFHAAEAIHPIVKPMTVFWLSQFAILALAVAVAAVPKPRWRVAAIGAVIALLGWNLVDKRPAFWWEDWRGAITTLQRDSRAVLLVEQQQTGMHANRACRLELRTDRCPLPIAVMDSRDTSYGWAREFMGTALLRRPALDAELLKYDRVYVVDYGGPDPLVSLGVIAPHPCCVPFLRGPYTPHALLSGKYPPQLP